MNFYFSGIGTFKDGPLKDSVIAACEHRLQSCHGAYVRTTLQWMNRAVRIGEACNQVMMLDSGAFTAWSKGHVMTIEELLPVYSQIFNNYRDSFKKLWFINLDVIPGSRDKRPTEQDIVEALRVSDVNYEILVKEFGDCILPVYHQGEDIARLAELEGMASYVCISPRQTLSEKVRVAWLDDVAARTKPSHDYHGLATTGARSITVNDWYSVDSASWVMVGAMGNILLPIGAWVKPLSVSADSPNAKSLGKHINTVSKIERATIERHLARHGFTSEEVITQHSHRMAFNFFVIHEAMSGVYKKQGDQQGLFN